jgi:hypothetical protein
MATPNRLKLENDSGLGAKDDAIATAMATPNRLKLENDSALGAKDDALAIAIAMATPSAISNSLWRRTA